MRRFLTLTMSAVLFTLLLSGCLVHEWPNPPSKVALHLSLEYDTDMDTTETIYGTRSQTSLTQSDIRYIIRAYPITKGGKAAQDFTDTCRRIRPRFHFGASGRRIQHHGVVRPGG